MKNYNSFTVRTFSFRDGKLSKRHLSAAFLFLFVIIPLLVALVFGPIQISQAFFPLTPPVTPPVTPPITPPITPTITPTPTPPLTPPVINQPPIILTKHLRNGKIGVPYFEVIKGYDVNGDRLTAEISSLPPGIYTVGCPTYSTNKASYITCFVKGVTTKAGKYSVSVRISDDKGGSTQKYFTLKILGVRKFFSSN